MRDSATSSDRSIQGSTGRASVGPPTEAGLGESISFRSRPLFTQAIQGIHNDPSPAFIHGPEDHVAVMVDNRLAIVAGDDGRPAIDHALGPVYLDDRDPDCLLIAVDGRLAFDQQHRGTVRFVSAGASIDEREEFQFIKLNLGKQMRIGVGS